MQNSSQNKKGNSYEKNNNSEERELEMYFPSNEELKKINFLMIPTGYCALTYIVFFSKFRPVYELLSFKEKLQYVFIYTNKICMLASVTFLPFFIDINDKKRMSQVSTKKKPSGSAFISSLDPKLKERILEMEIDRELLNKFDEQEKMVDVATLSDLRDLSCKTETEVYNTLNRMFKNNQCFMYCGPLLLNINPGPNYVNDYLNLDKFLKETKKIPEHKWKPHLYSFVHYIYQTLITENKDQVVNMLGQIGSGKTFNLIHILEYLCYTAGIQNNQEQTFDIIHRSIQLVHILSSILRQNNLESTSCGILLKLGFNEDNKICDFEIESKILDFTLPFSQNGRSFSILHALMTGANSDIKKNLDLPDHDHQLNFFKKYCKNFDEKTKEKIKLNDLEIWTRFHSLLNFFGFTKNEVWELLQLLAFILLCNEAAIGKKKVGKLEHEEFCINKGHSSRKLAKALGLSEEEFLNKFSTFKDLNEIKNTLISLMKHTYYMVLEFVKIKINNFLKKYFENLTGINLDKEKSILGSLNQNSFNQSFNNNQPHIKYIHFIDFPGEVDDQTLGGLSTNMANECLNVFAGTQYLSVVDKLNLEKLNLKYFQPLHSYYVTQSLLSPSGIFNYLSHHFTEENFKRLIRRTKTKDFYLKTTEFNENITTSCNEFMFEFKFSHMKINYHYESLFMETKSLIVNKNVMSIFTASKNSIIKSTIKSVLDPDRVKSFYNFTLNTIKDIFNPLEGLSPFVIYCLHSNNSLKIFFGDRHKDKHKDLYNKFYNVNECDWVIPPNFTMDMLKNSLAIPVLYWEWFGYHEWVAIDQFVKEFSDDFETIKETVLKPRKNYGLNILSKSPRDVTFKDLNSLEIVTYILSVLTSSKSYILGAHHVILKKGTLNEIRKMIDNMIENMTKAPKKTLAKRGSTPITNSILSKKKTISKKDINSTLNKSLNRNSASKKGITSNRSLSIGPTPDKPGNSKEQNSSNINNSFINNNNFSLINKESRNSFLEGNLNNSKLGYERKSSMKTQCHLSLISDIKIAFSPEGELNNNMSMSKINLLNSDKDPLSSFYNLFNIINKEYGGSQLNISQNSDYLTADHEVTLEKFRKDNNIIIPKKQYFNVFKNILEYKDIESFDVFDYNDYLPEVKKIQKEYRAYKARKRYKIFRYVSKRIIYLQKLARGFVIRRKFKRFLHAHTCVVFIQKLFRLRSQKKAKATLKIQAAWRAYRSYNKFLYKLEKFRNGEEWESEEEESNPQNFPESKKELEQELLNVSVKTDRRKITMNISAFTNNMKQENPMSIEELEEETDKHKIINHLLMEQIRAKKIDPELKVCLLDKTGITNRLKSSINTYNQGEHKKRRTSQIKNGIPKIEDKLIQYGEKVKMKLAEKKLEKIHDEENKYSFKPQLKPTVYDSTRLGQNFMQRQQYYKYKQERNLEEIRNNNVDPGEYELTFKPQVSEFAKGIKRNMNDLFYWKHKKQEELHKKQLEKEYLEMEEIEKTTTMPKMNRNSQIILKNKTERTLRETMNNKEEQLDFDIWPVQMEKNYFERKEDC